MITAETRRATTAAPAATAAAAAAAANSGATSPRASHTRCAVICCAALAMTALIWYFAASAPAPGKIFGRFGVARFAAASAATYALALAAYCLTAPRGSMRLRVARCFLASFALLLVLAPLELLAAARVVDFRRLFAPPESALFTLLKPWHNPANRPDAELLHIHRPNQQMSGKTVGDLVHWLGIATDRSYQVDVRYDSRGFRNDREITAAPVVLIGDSFVEAGLVPTQELLSSTLSRRLGVDVANLGQSDYGPQQELIVLKRYALPLQPKVVFWFFFEGNDLLNVPRYERVLQNWDQLTAPAPFRERSFSRNALLSLARYTEPRRQQDTETARRHCGQFTRARDDDAKRMYFAYSAGPLGDEDLVSLGKVQDMLRDAAGRCEDVGARLVLVFVPTKFRVYGRLCRFEPDAVPRTWQCNDLPERMAAWCRQNNLPFADLTAPLHDAAAAGELVFFTDDGHWNAAGNRVAAHVLSDLISQRRLLPTPAVTATPQSSPRP